MMYRDHQINVSVYDLKREVTTLSKEYDWIKAVQSQVKQDVCYRLDKAYKKFFSGGGFPKWAKRGKYTSFTFPQSIKVAGNKIWLPKIGWVKYRNSREFPEGATLKTATVIECPDGWFVSVAFAYPPKSVPPREKQAVGIDMGIAQFATTSEGEVITNPRHFDKHRSRIRVLQRKLARQKKGGSNRKKTKNQLSKAWLKLANCRKDFLHKTSTYFADQYTDIIVEDLRLVNMIRSAKGTVEDPGKCVKAKSGLNRSMLDLGVGIFFEMLAYKTTERGGTFEKVNPAYTSQTCNKCGYRSRDNRKSQAEFVCVKCGHEANADLNASENILGRGSAFDHQRGAVAHA